MVTWGEAYTNQRSVVDNSTYFLLLVTGQIGKHFFSNTFTLLHKYIYFKAICHCFQADCSTQCLKANRIIISAKVSLNIFLFSSPNWEMIILDILHAVIFQSLRFSALIHFTQYNCKRNIVWNLLLVEVWISWDQCAYNYNFRRNKKTEGGSLKFIFLEFIGN